MGRKYRLSGSYYRRNVWNKGECSNLHRDLWQEASGPIPEGWHVHHIDGDTFNNNLSNLFAMDGSEHISMHTRELIQAGALKPPSRAALERAAEWHRSDAGREWHRAHGKNSWANREWHARNCDECGQEYHTPYPTRSKFCHANCKARAKARRQGKPVGVRPSREKPRVLSGKRADGK